MLDELTERFPDGQARMWGVVPGKNGANVSKAKRLQAGDFVLFYGDKKLYLAGTVAVRWENQALAERLWGLDHRNQTWEYMYALTDVRQIAVPIEEVQPLLGWSAKAVVQGFNIYEGAKAAGLRELCNLSVADDAVPEDEELVGPENDPDHQRQAGSSAGTSFDGPTDRTTTRQVRREQAALKQRLRELGKDICALCGRSIPADLLVAAHIKKRSKCDEKERLDFDRVGMLACLLNCDALYERGYISVDRGGKLLISAKVEGSPELKTQVKLLLEGRITPWWTEERERYFEWHRTHVFLQML
nr:hypothetical protein GCM10020241_54000 [Streptoalloteichus tenebrarius]